MGPYLSKPQTEVHSSTCSNGHFVYCTAEMQGWRKTQEDAHVALLNYDDKGSVFFAVFDGHGGDEISKYCSFHLPDFIKNSSLYKDNKIVEALEDSFLKFDQTLKQPDVLAELKKLASIDEANDIDDNETSDLRKEASMPLEEVITKNFKYYCDSVKEDKEFQNGKDDSNENSEGDKDKSFEEKLEQGSSSTSNTLLKKKNHLLKSETLKAFLDDYLSEDEDEDEEESEEENGEFVESSSNDEDEEDEDEYNDDDDNDNDDDDDDDDDDDLEDDGIDLSAGLKNVFNLEYNEPGKGSGCTAIVAIIRDNTLYVANVGDSRCVLSREGKAVDMSEDHKPEDEKEKSRILKAGGEITVDGRVNGGLNLSRAIGDHMYKNNRNISDREQMITALPDVRTCKIDLDKDDFLFLACDGIWNSMNSQEVITFINERLKANVDLKLICEELFKVCLAPNTEGDGSGCDNMTCILVKFKKNQSNLSPSNNVKRPLDDDCESSLNVEHSESNTIKRNKTNDKDNENDLFKPGPSRN